ncbi:two-component system response regulator LytT [Dysgonomonas sp. PFB1-18]|uniref:LytR/AlgR family response regulator transcription factor n=1 Tax=unclassified Dysgonomonas TaxID=2630389 RepID=UPI002474E444|nr:MULTISPECIES: LytTR family DNA-binding domain-containing protein [unclassified Dysgonomonas]MDH6307646.1 two-component system response regulator LytT [Dysgonomonas sp. PF1-14]MDH6337564.1 two-component system response regulator LytT [Dysgonomonas sp. PF1-16]MDH6378788.1 two-component system response regulator LytT [Dysgonomonas sp. PFB1-18]MDH6399206.1 two-component system response regulator LytT [Dysgonomonas sp. PF1-23]
MIKYLIVEDERFAYEEIQRMTGRLRPGYQLTARTETVRETIQFLKTNTPDLIILDIHLADGSCFEIFEQIEVSTPIIFTTAYDEHAIQAFKVNSIDYLLKPIEEADLLAALNKYEQLHSAKQPDTDYKRLQETLIGNYKRNRFLTQIGDTYHHIGINEIAFFYSEDKVTFLHTFADKRYIIDYTLTQIEGQLDNKTFFRVSRNCIANISSIRKISKYFNSRLKLSFQPECPHEILISRERVSDFLKWVDGII